MNPFLLITGNITVLAGAFGLATSPLGLIKEYNMGISKEKYLDICKKNINLLTITEKDLISELGLMLSKDRGDLTKLNKKDIKERFNQLKKALDTSGYINAVRKDVKEYFNKTLEEEISKKFTSNEIYTKIKRYALKSVKTHTSYIYYCAGMLYAPTKEILIGLYNLLKHDISSINDAELLNRKVLSILDDLKKEPASEINSFDTRYWYFNKACNYTYFFVSGDYKHINFGKDRISYKDGYKSSLSSKIEPVDLL